MQNTTIYVTRHGQTVGNSEKRMQGHHDSPLTPLGEQQASWLGEALKGTPINTIYSSTSLRTQRTAAYIRGKREIPIIPREDLREIGLGVWEGLLDSEIRTLDTARYEFFWNSPHLYQPPEGGESVFDVQQRAIPAVKEIIARHPGETTLIVTHAATLKVILGFFEERPLEKLWEPPFIHPTALCKIVIVEDKPVIELHGDISHYRDTEETFEAR